MRERPIGLHLAQVQKTVARAFNEALAEAGGTVPVWLVLHSIARGSPGSQLHIARSVGIEGPTLTRHLDGLEEAGLVARRRDPADRRAVQVELTEIGEELHGRLLQAVIVFQRRLTSGLSETEIERTKKTLLRMEQNLR